MKFILGTKQNMTEYFSEDGRVWPATLISAGPIVVTQLKTKDKDGYEAVQIGYEDQKASRLPKAKQGHLKGSGGLFKHLKEFPLIPDVKVGDKIDVSAFNEGDTIEISGVSKGKGFQGVVKRYNFEGGRRTHGQKHSEREPGSIGGGLRTHVPKGMRMAGRMGSDRVTIKNLKVLKIDAANNQLLVAGAIPGRRGTLIEIVAR
jgi:large subunit ribosomal protein L3